MQFPDGRIVRWSQRAEPLSNELAGDQRPDPVRAGAPSAECVKPCSPNRTGTDEPPTTLERSAKHDGAGCPAGRRAGALISRGAGETVILGHPGWRIANEVRDLFQGQTERN